MGNASGVHSIGGKEVMVVKQIGEGGFAEILLVKSVKGKEKYALKRMSVHRDDKEKQLIAQWEYQISQALPAHPNIVRCEGATQLNLPNGDTEYLLLLEYCSDGTLLDWLNKPKDRSIRDVMTVFAQVAAAVAVFHAHQPPISHRDLKPENVLRGDRDEWKLCDFGSASTDTYIARTSGDRVTIAAIIDKNTTPSYRAPEMVDLYRPQLINQQSDVWALGVMLYQLLFREQPFPDGSLGIVSGKYRVPEQHKWPKEALDLLQRMLTVDPARRATIIDVQIGVGEILKKQPRLADPWSMPFTSASLAAASAALAVARAKSPALSPRLAPNGAAKEPSTSRNSNNATPEPAEPAAEGKKEKKDRKGKKDRKALKPPVPAFPAHDDFDAAFPASPTAEGPQEAGEAAKQASAFLSPELMKAKGIQWEDAGAGGQGGERKEGEREALRGEGEAEEEMREPSGGNGSEDPYASPVLSPASPAGAEAAPLTIATGSLSLPAPRRALGVVLSPPPPSSAGGGRSARRERSQATSPVPVAASPPSPSSLQQAEAAAGEDGKEAKDGRDKKDKKGKKDKKEKADKKEKKEKKERKAEAEVAAAVAAAAASSNPASTPVSPPPMASPTGGDAHTPFGDSSAWGAEEEEDGEGSGGEDVRVVVTKASKASSGSSKRSSFLAAKLKGVLSSASEKVSAMTHGVGAAVGVGGGAGEESSRKEPSRVHSKSVLEDEDEDEDEEGELPALPAGGKEGKAVSKSRSLPSLSRHRDSEEVEALDEMDDEVSRAQLAASAAQSRQPAATAAVPSSSSSSSSTGLAAPPESSKSRKKGKEKEKEREKAEKEEKKPESAAHSEAAQPPSLPAAAAAASAAASAEEQQPAAALAPAALSPPSSSPTVKAASPPAAAFPAQVDLDDPFGDKEHFDAQQQQAAADSLHASFGSSAAWPPAIAVSASAPSFSSSSLPVPEQKRTGSASSSHSAHTPSLSSQPAAASSRKDSFDSFDPFASQPAPAAAEAKSPPQQAGRHEQAGEQQAEEEWGSEPAGWVDPSASSSSPVPSISIDTSLSSSPSSPALPVPPLDPRENDYLQFRYTNANSERDEFLLQSPRHWLLADASLPLQSLDDAVTKATKKDNGAPRYKYTRQLLLSSWAHRVDEAAGGGDEEETVSAQGWLGLPDLFKSLSQRPVQKQSSVAFKSLLLLHKLMQYGSPAVLGQLFVNRQFVLSLQQAWTDSELLSTPVSSSSPVHDLLLPYSKYVMRRIYFIYQYRQFEGNFSLGYYLYRLFRHAGWPHAWTLPPTVTRDQILALIACMHDALLVAALVFEAGAAAGLGEEATLLRQSILVPLMDDLYAQWLSATFLMNQLCLYTATACLLPGQSLDEANSAAAAAAAVSLPVNGSGLQLSSPQTPHTPSISLSTMTNSTASRSEEEEVAASMPAVIAHHRTITDRLHLFFSTVAPLPSVSPLRRLPNLPGRVNPFQPTPPVHFPPPSNIPRVGLDNAVLSWRFQAQCGQVGESKRRVYVQVDDDLSRYQLMMEQEKRRQHEQQQQQQQQKATQAHSQSVEEEDEADQEAEDEDEQAEAVASPGDPNSPFYEARMAHRAQLQQEKKRQTEAASAPAIPQNARVASGNPFGDEMDNSAAAPARAAAPAHVGNGAQRAAAPTVDLVDFFSAPAAAASAASHPIPPRPAVAADHSLDLFAAAAQPPSSFPPMPPQLPARPPAATVASALHASPAPPPLPAGPRPAAPLRSLLSTPFSDEVDPSDLSYTALIGEGAASEVWSGQYQQHTDVAIRRFRPEIYLGEEGRLQFRVELELLRKLRHPHVVLFMGACTLQDSPLSVVTELMDCSLFRLLHETEETLAWSQWLQVALDAAKGLLYLHSFKPQPVVHGDLKSVNVLLDGHRRAKLTDFLLARSKQRDEERGWQWTAPEVLQGEAVSTHSDVFSFGLIMWELVTRSVPYAAVQSTGREKVEQAVITRAYRPQLPANCPADYSALLQACWAQKPAARPTAAQLVDRVGAMLTQARQAERRS